MKSKLFIFVYILVVISSSAQTLTLPTNAPRHSDVLCKVEIPDVEVGERGEDAMWQIGRVKDDCPGFLQAIKSNGDTIAIYEEGRMLHFLVCNDTLYDKGVQSRRAHRVYDLERPALRYPFVYGDSIAGNYSGKGRYENTTYTVTGTGYTVADGMGVLTDGEDTLRHVTRLHLHDEYTLDYGTDLAPQQLVEERYLWYCAGYRYPVQETQLVSLRDGTDLVPVGSTAYLYLPVMQLEDLAEDEANAQLLAALAAADAESAENTPADAVSSVGATLSSDGMSLTIQYTLDADAPLSFIACDLTGSLLGSAHYESQPAGEWQEHISLTRRPLTGALMLNVQSGAQTLTLKVVAQD